MNMTKTILGTMGVGILILGGVFWLKTKETQALPYGTKPTVSLLQAVETVLAANPGTAAVDATLERENNDLAWEVKLNNHVEVYIDAQTNQIIKIEQGWSLKDVAFLRDFLPQ